MGLLRDQASFLRLYPETGNTMLRGIDMAHDTVIDWVLYGVYRSSQPRASPARARLLAKLSPRPSTAEFVPVAEVTLCVPDTVPDNVVVTAVLVAPVLVTPDPDPAEAVALANFSRPEVMVIGT